MRGEKGILNFNSGGFTKEEPFTLAIEDEWDFHSWDWDTGAGQVDIPD